MLSCIALAVCVSASKKHDSHGDEKTKITVREMDVTTTLSTKNSPLYCQQQLPQEAREEERPGSVIHLGKTCLFLFCGSLFRLKKHM